MSLQRVARPRGRTRRTKTTIQVEELEEEATFTPSLVQLIQTMIQKEKEMETVMMKAVQKKTAMRSTRRSPRRSPRRRSRRSKRKVLPLVTTFQTLRNRNHKKLN